MVGRCRAGVLIPIKAAAVKGSSAGTGVADRRAGAPGASLHGMPPTTFRASIQLLRTRRFGTFWVASLLSSIGTCTQQVAQPWLLLSLGAPFWYSSLSQLLQLRSKLAEEDDVQRKERQSPQDAALTPAAVVAIPAGDEAGAKT